MAERGDARPVRRLVIGIGNPDRGDDAAGCLVARLLSGRTPEDVQVFEHSGDAAGLLEHLQRAESVHLIDACVSGAPVGQVRRFDCAAGPLPRDALQVSTHGFGPAESIELGRALEILPANCVMFVIELRSVDAGAGISDTIREAAHAVAAQILEELQGSRPPGIENTGGRYNPAKSIDLLP